MALAVVRVGKLLSEAAGEETRMMMMMMAKTARRSRLIRSLRSSEKRVLFSRTFWNMLCVVSHLVWKSG